MTVPIIGIDPSVTSTGLCWPDGHLDLLRPPSKLRGGERLDWIERHLARGWRLRPPPPEVAIIEDYGPLSARFGQTAFRLGEVRGVFLSFLHRHDCLVVLVPPARLKRWATGNAHASKDAMIEALPPGVSLRCETDDQADAWHLHDLGDHGLNGARLDRTDPRHGARLDVLSSIDWPVLR